MVFPQAIKGQKVRLVSYEMALLIQQRYKDTPHNRFPTITMEMLKMFGKDWVVEKNGDDWGVNHWFGVRDKDAGYIWALDTRWIRVDESKRKLPKWF